MGVVDIDEKIDENAEEMKRPPIFRDIRRYYCEYCGICRSKKTLINSHILSHHKEEIEKQSGEKESTSDQLESNTCQECGASFKKPAHLKQHMQSHSLEMLDKNGDFLSVKHWIPQKNSKMREAASFHLNGPVPGWETAWEAPSSEPLSRSFQLERPFICPVDDCNSSYCRKDHLNRHLLQHKGKLFRCPNADCNREFVYKSNMQRHIKQFHCEDIPSANSESPKKNVCQEVGCGKVFRYASRLRKHEDSHVNLQSVEAFCAEPGCKKVFTNERCLREHIQMYHLYITCEICGKKQLKKNIKRHLCTHEVKDSSERINCYFDGCSQTFSTKFNLQQHVKAVHLEQKPFACGFSGCGMRFSYKHVRDNHEKSGIHVYTTGNFVESDEQWRQRPRGGRKRMRPTVEMLVRKRVSAPSGSSPTSHMYHAFQADTDNDVDGN